MATITEDYVSFEIAKLLKEKGFSGNTICKYADVGGITEKYYDDYRERVLRFDWEEGYLIEPLMEPKDQYEIIGNTILAPTLQMAMKWLREICGLIINIEYKDICPTWKWRIYIKSSDKKHTNFQHYDTYEQAVEAAIKYSLKNLI